MLPFASLPLEEVGMIDDDEEEEENDGLEANEQPTAMRQILHKRFSRSSDAESLYDGEQYKKHTEPGGFLSPDFPDNIYLTISTDGVAVFKSEVWPIWIAINELPPKQRYINQSICTD